MKPVILFVDDELNILQGLRRMLRRKRNDWDMRFALGGDEALKILEDTPVSAIVSDMRMPGMNGGVFLARAALRHPNAARFILSGEADRELILKTIANSHRFLTKPCDPDTLIASIEEPLAMLPAFDEAQKVGWIAQIGDLWSPQESHDALSRELNAPETTLDVVAELVARDPGMSARVLQLANSAYFGPPKHTASIPDAVAHLGLGVLHTLTQREFLTAQGPSMALPQSESGYTPNVLARTAREAAQTKTNDTEFVETAYTVGLLWALCDTLPDCNYTGGPAPRALAPAYLAKLTGLPAHVGHTLSHLASLEPDVSTDATAEVIVTSLAEPGLMAA